MSTNYYIKGYTDSDVDKDSPEWHVGKRTGAGIGKTNFTWAIDPKALALRLQDLGFTVDEKCIVSERGKEYSWLNFLEQVIDKATLTFDNAIGLKFS